MLKLNSSAQWRILVCLAAILAGWPSRVALSQSIDASPTASASTPASEVSKLDGSLKIVKLLWKSNPKIAASTLSKSLSVALDRGHHAALPDVLEPMQASFETVTEIDDPRFAVSVAALALLKPQDSGVRAGLIQAIESDKASNIEVLVNVWFKVDPEAAFKYFESNFQNSPKLTLLPVLMQHALATDRSRAAGLILEGWEKWPRELQVSAIEPMTAQANTMLRVIKAVEAGRVSKDLVNMNQLRKWQSSSDANLVKAIEGVWGRVRESDDAERQKLVQDKLKLLRSSDSRGSVARGLQVFTRVCSQCHQLHGQGFEVGPAITNNGRGNLEQLVSNVFDPSLVIGAAFQAKTVLTVDGEVVSGLVVADDERFLRLKVQGGKVLEFSKTDDVEQVKSSSKSLMPEGLEAQMTDQELIDLFAYLCLVKAPDAPDNELISGTPEQLVNP